MRKFLAVILAVLTLVTIVLPVFAAEATAAADKTTADDAKNLGLIVTEYISDTKSPDVGAIGDVSSATYNAFQFIEIYNSSDVDVDLYKVAIAATSNDKDANGNKYWDDLHVFQKKMQLRAGSIYNGVSFKDGQESLKANKAENPNSAVLGAGKTAIIWFWNDSTTTIAAKMTTSPGAPDGDVYHKGFRDFYNVPSDTLVLAVYAGSDSAGSASPSPSAACTRFYLNISSGWYTYALIDESGMGAAGWSVDTPAWTREDGYNAKVLCMFGWGVQTLHGLSAAQGRSTVYVPANTTPDLYNENIKASLEEGETFTPVADYVANAYVGGYKEVAVLDFDQEPTPGTVPAWQAAYIAASKGATMDATQKAAVDAFVNATKIVPEVVAGGTEEKIDITFKDRSELGNQGTNKKDTSTKKKSAGWVLPVAIGGGAAVLLAAAAVVVFVVILPKKKKAAAAAAAAVVEDAPVAAEEQAPVEAVEEAPAVVEEKIEE